MFGNAIISGTSRYLNFGTLPGASGYGIRDNAGTMEFKNSGESWTPFGGTGGGVPSGAVMPFNLSSCPTGWTVLTGAAGRFIVGVGNNETNNYALGASGGADSQTLTVAQLPAHSHTVTDAYPGASQNNGLASSGLFNPGADPDGGSTVRTTSSVGSGTAVDVRPAYFALLYCQKD